MSEQVKIESNKSGLWQDRKFLRLIASVALVAVFEFLSLTGEDYKLLRNVALPFFAVLILAVGWRTLRNGLKALSKLNFRSINLLRRSPSRARFISANSRKRRSSSSCRSRPSKSTRRWRLRRNACLSYRSSGSEQSGARNFADVGLTVIVIIISLRLLNHK